MYKLTKPKGYTAIVTITNEETHASLDIGAVSIPMLEILDKAGILSPEEGETRVFNDWNFSIEKDIADKITPLAMSIKKPMRYQSKQSTPEEVKVNNKNVDAMDVLLGLACYK